LGEVHYFIQEESVGSRHYFHSAFECLESFFEILKWQNLVSFLQISKAEQQNKSSLPAGLFTPNGIGNTQVKPCSLINQLPKKCCFKLDLQWNPNDFDRDFGFLVCCILMPNSI
jgi:hypothetical protein